MSAHPGQERFIRVSDYDLAATLTSGQAFRWRFLDGAWEGVVGRHWVRLGEMTGGIHAQTVGDQSGWAWLTEYLQTHVDLAEVLKTFPDDPPMRAAVKACRGLRLVRQDKWECLASFICSATKQIVQIQQIVAALCERFGSPVPVPAGHAPTHSFPEAPVLARLTEADLRACKLGFRAPKLLGSARMIDSGLLDLNAITELPLEHARERLMELPGVGPKIANCVLLFAYDYPAAFPVDVWVLRALRELYFPRRRPAPKKLRRFVATHFGPYAGYAQQYLFHYMRQRGRVKRTGTG